MFTPCLGAELSSTDGRLVMSEKAPQRFTSRMLEGVRICSSPDFMFFSSSTHSIKTPDHYSQLTALSLFSVSLDDLEQQWVPS